MQQDTLVTLLKQLRHNQAQILLVVGFLVVVTVGIFVWFSDTPTQSSAPTPSSQTESTQALPDDSATTVVSEVADKTEAAPERTYTVQPGESLWSIAETELGSGELYRELAEKNKLHSNEWLEIGQQLTLPTLREKDTAQISRDQILYGAENYTVVANDSLWKIAEKQLGDPYRWPEIYAENRVKIGENPDLIYPDTALVLPARTTPEHATQ